MPAPECEILLQVVAHPAPELVGSSHPVHAGEPLIIGRSPCDIPLIAPSISRRHAAVRLDGSLPSIVDLHSRHGTFVNGSRIEAGTDIELAIGDEIRIGPVLLHVRPGATTRDLITLAGDRAGTEHAMVVPESERGGLAQRRLDALLQSASILSSAPDLPALAAVVTQAASQGTHSARVLLLRPTERDDDLEILGRHVATEHGDDETSLSRSLVRLALEGQLAELTEEQSSSGPSPSIAGLVIRSAIGAPIRVDGQVEAVLYLDARGQESRLEPDAAAFCEALAELCGLALANQRRLVSERQRALLQRDAETARRVQQQIMPPPSGTAGPIAYAMVSVPGRLVAGDLLDVVEIDGRRAVVVLGDVAGKGVGAAILMATAQTFLRAAVQQSLDIPQVLADLNRFVYERCSDGTFLTLWLGLFDATTGTVQFADAGHGHW
ncbi:MAG: SpoIIE family protein phosphatase, partial [Planctomycetota bacterium]